MSLRLEMLQVARLAPKLLGDSAPLVEKFLRSQQNDDGGFKDRSGRSDLYYTVFGLEGLLAVERQRPTFNIQHSTPNVQCSEVAGVFEKVKVFLSSFWSGDNL